MTTDTSNETPVPNEYYLFYSPIVGKYLVFNVEELEVEMIEEAIGPLTKERAFKQRDQLNNLADLAKTSEYYEPSPEEAEADAKREEEERKEFEARYAAHVAQKQKELEELAEKENLVLPKEVEEDDEDDGEEDDGEEVTEPRVTTHSRDPKTEEKLNPHLWYKNEDIPEEIKQIIRDAKLMPYVYRDPKGRWFAGYSYYQVQMIRNISNLHYVRQRATQDDGPQIIRTIPIKPGSDTQIVILDIYSSHTFKYTPRDGDSDTHTYQLKADGVDWPQIRALLEKLNVKWEDVTEKHREYHRRAKANQKSKSKGNKKKNQTPKDNHGFFPSDK